MEIINQPKIKPLQLILVKDTPQTPFSCCCLQVHMISQQNLLKTSAKLLKTSVKLYSLQCNLYLVPQFIV